nr:hypothetical protein [Piscirickettsia salmonis]
MAALSTKHGIAPTLISKWKKDLLERGCELSGNKKTQRE